MASKPQKRLSAKTPVCVCLHACSHPTQRLCQLLREREIWGMHRDINATPCMCVSVYLCQGGVRRQLRFHIAPRKRLELEACYNAKYTLTYMHTYKGIYEDIWWHKIVSGNGQTIWCLYYIVFDAIAMATCVVLCCVVFEQIFVAYYLSINEFILSVVILQLLQNDSYLVFSFELELQLSVLGH